MTELSVKIKRRMLSKERMNELNSRDKEFFKGFNHAIRMVLADIEEHCDLRCGND